MAERRDTAFTEILKSVKAVRLRVCRMRRSAARTAVRESDARSIDGMDTERVHAATVAVKGCETGQPCAIVQPTGFVRAPGSVRI